MSYTVMLEFVFFFICLLIALSFIMMGIMSKEYVDYDKLISAYKEQQQNAIEDLKKGNKKIQRIEMDIRTYKKKLGLSLVNNKKNK